MSIITRSSSDRIGPAGRPGDDTHTPVLRLADSGAVLSANAAWCDLVECAPAAKPPALLPLIDPVDRDAVDAAFAAASERRVAAEVACRLMLARPVDLNVVFVPKGQDAVEAILLEHQASAQALEIDMLRRQLAALMEISSEAILMVNRHMVIAGVNRGAESIFGYSAAEMIGRRVETLMPPRFRTGHQSHVDAFTAGDRSSRLMSERSAVFGLRKNGEEFPAEASITKTGAGESISYSIVLRDVTQRHRAEAELFAAKRAAEAANLAKSQFLATMSHELRTPLNAIIGFSEIIANRLFGDDSVRYAHYAADIHGSGQHLLAIIDEILDLSRIEVGAEIHKLEWVQPKDLVADSLLLVRHRAAKNGIALVSDIVSGTPAVMVDRRRMRQVIVNLLANAVKFTARGGRVQVDVKPVGEELEIAVRDNGIGIPREQLEQVFEPFHQVADHRNCNQEGTGLGLAIARRICERHGGRLVAESEIGIGTCMRILLPLGETTRVPATP